MSSVRNRLVVSHLAVALVGAATTVLVVVLEAPAQFDRGMNGRGMGMGQQGAYRDLFMSALRDALLIGSVAALVIAIVAAWVIAVRLARPIEDVRRATRAIRGGDYDLQISAPREVELADLVGDVNAMAHQLREVESERVRLLGDVAHEMRTPLTVLTGRVEGLQDGVFTADPELLAGLGAELRRLQRLADDLGTLSRVEERRLILEKAPVDLAELARGAVDRFDADPRARGVEWRVNASEPVVVDADVQRLGQVLDNLLSNALRAVTGDGQISVEVGADAATAIVSVTDTGAGITADEVERIFERFYRGRDARPGEGTGVGLSVSRGIAEAHGGSLVAESAGLGHGARFTLTVPREPTPAHR